MRPVPFALTLAASFALSLAACRSDPPEARVEPTDIRTSLEDCMNHRVDVGLARLDSLLDVAPGHADVLAIRGQCRAVRFAADSVQADARAASADLTAAIEAVTARPGMFQTPLDALYNQRAFVGQALRPGDWAGSLADFRRAVELNPRNSSHILDRGVAHAMAGDTASARLDLRKFRALAPDDTARADALRAMIGDSTLGTPRSSENE